MKRMTKAEMKKRHLIWLLLGVACIAVGIIMIVAYLFFPHPSYEELQTKEIVVESVVYIRGTRFSWPYYRIKASNGERYTTCGAEVLKMEKKLLPGDQVVIKYHDDTSIDELKKGEEFLVTYVDHNDTFKVSGHLMCLALLLGGGMFIKGYFLCVKSDIRKQENRDKRIKKKYGEKSKIK